VTELGRTVGTKITSDQFLDKSVLKKLVAKKSEAMFPETMPKKKKKVVTLLVDEENRVKVDQKFFEKSDMSFALKPPSNFSRTSKSARRDSITSDNRTNTYSYMMKQLRKKIDEMPYVKKDPEFLARR